MVQHYNEEIVRETIEDRPVEIVHHYGPLAPREYDTALDPGGFRNVRRLPHGPIFR